jgi:vesicle-associated membrane protein 7
MSYVYDGYYFHFIQLDCIVYLTLTGEDYPRRKAFEFLAKLKSAYLEHVGLSSHDDFEKILAFHPTLESIVKEYSKQDAIDKVQKDVEQVRNIMTQNIEKVKEFIGVYAKTCNCMQVLNRGERIDNLVDMTESLSRQSLQFRSSTRSISRDLYFKNMKVNIVISIVVILILFVFLFCIFQ